MIRRPPRSTLFPTRRSSDLERFEGKGYLFSKEPSGGIGCFTPDSFPVFDLFRQNAYAIADSNHGYKMIGVGALVAKELDRKSTRLNSSHANISYAVFCLKKK